MVRFLLVLTIMAASCPAWAGSRPIKVSVKLSEDPSVGVLEPFLFGSNLQWIERGDTIQNDKGEWDEVKYAAVDKFKTTLLRFPGGQLSSRYDWEKGVGPAETRGEGPNFEGDLRKMHFGTEEYVDLLARMGARGLITLNLKKDPAASAEWLRFIRERGKRHSPPVDVEWWEVGNESFIKMDPSFVSAEEYVRRFKGHYDSLKAEEPAAKVGALLEANFLNIWWVADSIPEHETWNDTVLAGLKKNRTPADFYGIHFYALFGVEESNRKNRQALLVAPAVIGDKIRLLKETIQKHDSEAPLFVTEFNIHMGDTEATWKYCLDLVQGAYFLDLLMVFAQNGVKAACSWTLLDCYNFGMYGYNYWHTKTHKDTFVYRPAAEVYIGLADYHGRERLKTEFTAPDVKFSPVGIVFSTDRAAVVNALGVKGKNPGDGPALLAVNRSIADTVELDCEFAGTKIKPAAVRKLAGQVRFAPKIDSGKNTVSLPPMSAVVIEYEAAP